MFVQSSSFASDSRYISTILLLHSIHVMGARKLSVSVRGPKSGEKSWQEKTVDERARVISNPP